MSKTVSRPDRSSVDESFPSAETDRPTYAEEESRAGPSGLLGFARSPMGVVTILLASILVAELIAQAVSSTAPAMPKLAEDLLDDVIVMILALPALRVFVFKPLTRELHVREAFEARLEQERQILEHRVDERTAELRAEVAERKQAEVALQQLNVELEQRVAERSGELERFFSVSIDMLCIANSDGYFKRLSPAFSHSLGWSIEELQARPFLDFVHPDDREATLAEVDRQVRAGEPVLQFQNRYQAKDGSWRVLSWKSVPQQGGFMYAVARDITEQQQLDTALRQAKEQAEAANLAKSDFLSRMSHELRTPMNSVMGYAQLLELQYEEPKIKEASRLILKAGKHLLELINEVLDLSRIESGNLSISREPVALAEVLTQAFSLMQPIADRSGISLIIEGTGPEAFFVLADQQRLLQSVINLISNGIKYNRPGGRVTVRYAEPGAGTVRLDIADTGRGIGSEDQHLLFQPFQRFGATGIEGTGLGLALSQRFVQLMGGQLTLVESTGEGSTFSIELQRSAVTRPALTVRSTEGPATSPLTGRRGVVLYIEDNVSNMQLLEMMLEDWTDISLIPAAQGLIGLELAREHRPDLILLDVHLPDLMGDKVLERLKAAPETQLIPVVVLSADATPKQIAALTSRGAVDYLVKPLDLKRLAEVFQQYLPSKAA